MRDLILLLVNLNLGRRLFQSKVMKGVKPLLLMPETNALSERLYFKLKRIKTYHKSNLNHNRSTSIGNFYTTWIFFSIWVFFHEHSRFRGQQEKGETIFLTPLYHFHPFHRHLDIGCAITAESSLLHIASSRNRTGNLFFFRAQVTNH